MGQGWYRRDGNHARTQGKINFGGNIAEWSRSAVGPLPVGTVHTSRHRLPSGWAITNPLPLFW